MSIQDAFHRFCKRAAIVVGTPWAVLLSFLIVFSWLVTGPYFHFSDTWQLVINTATTVAEFLMVFLIQHTQNRDTLTIQLKLDELIRATKRARNQTIDIESLSDRELSELRKEFEIRAQKARKRRRRPKR